MGNATRPELARIYTLSDPRTFEVRYVGMTTRTLEVRLRGHLRNTREKNHRSRWVRSLVNAGLVPLIAEIEAVPVDQHAEAERRWIAIYRAQGARLVNSTDGGDGTFGHKMSPEARKRISDSKKGKVQVHLLKYRHLSPSEDTKERIRQTVLRNYQDHPELRAEISRVHKGKSISEQHRRIVGAATRRRWEEWRASGATVSEETRALISAAARARPPHPQSAAARAKNAESKRQLWAVRRETGEDMAVRALMREGIVRSGKRALTGLGTVRVDADGTVHGYTGYKHGCRCDVCQAAQTAIGQARAAILREARRNAPRPPRFCQTCGTDISHRYSNARYCEACKATAEKQARLRFRQKAAASRPVAAGVIQPPVSSPGRRRGGAVPDRWRAGAVEFRAWDGEGERGNGGH